MPYDAYLMMEGMEGGATREGFEKQIALESVSLSADNPTSAGAGAGKGSGKANVHPISFTKFADPSSTDLFQACVTGKHVPTAKLTFHRAGGDEAVDYMVIDLEGCFVEAYSMSGSSGGGDQPIESCTIAYNKITYTYTPQADTGAKEGPKVASWDLKAVTK